METNNSGYQGKEFSALFSSTVNLSNAILLHNENMERHIKMMEDLTRSVAELEASLKKTRKLGEEHPSLQLKQALTAFMEYYINPRFYEIAGYAQLPEAFEKNKARLTAGAKQHSTN